MLFNGLYLMKSLVFLVITCKVYEFDSKRIPDKTPKFLGAQIHKSNTPTESGSDYFQREITIPLLCFFGVFLFKINYKPYINQLKSYFNGFVTVLATLLAIIVQKPGKSH